MDKNAEFYREMLEKMKDNYSDAEKCILRTPEEGLPTYILSVLLGEIGEMNNEVFGEMYFLPTPYEHPEADIFTVVYNIEAEISNDYFECLEKAVNAMNFYLPIGAAVLDKKRGILSFKYASMIPRRFEKDDFYRTMRIAAKYALIYIEPFVDALVDMSRGFMDIEGFYSYLSQIK